jgi:hypothetical protein
MFRFDDLPTARDYFFETPEFSCNGHDWALRIYPGQLGYVVIYLSHRSEGKITDKYELQIIDKFGKKRKAFQFERSGFEGMDKIWGWKNAIKRSTILDESQNILDSDGELTVAVSVKEELPPIFASKSTALKTKRRRRFRHRNYSTPTVRY